MYKQSNRTVAFFKTAIFLVLLSVDNRVVATNSLLDFNLVNSWAQDIGAELWKIGEYFARKKEAQNSFAGSRLEERDGNKLVQEIAANVYDLLKTGKKALQAIVTEAEAIVAERMNKEAPLDYVYLGSKTLDVRPTYLPKVPLMDMSVNKESHFGDLGVNTDFSSVHVPTDVSDWANSSRKAAQWSENLDKVFIANYEKYRFLSWQYFGTSTGIMRHYPAMNWIEDEDDIYDCRNRPWFTEATISSTDMVIIVDMSGSMTMGYYVQIAWHIVANLLDTLGNNDYVSVLLMVNNTIYYPINCFADTLVQANLLNVRELKRSLESIEPYGLANFELALNTSFELLAEFRKKETECHQAIMIISDGFHYNYYDIFKEYNINYKPNMPVRVFTYLIGFKSDNKREAVWIACANKGYFVHIENEAEVRQKVFQYIPVMARPISLYGDQHPLVWTPVYANFIDTLYNEYEWERKLAEEQAELVKVYRSNKTIFKTKVELIKRFNRTQKKQNDQFGSPDNYMLMTSISMPAFNKSRNDPLLWNLLGVAGTDIPVNELKLLMKPQKLGVNGYAFIVTNNGYVLFHPDFRPVFQGILKPGYSTVDILELELMNDKRAPRDLDDELLIFRNDILEQWNGSRWVEAKYHYENMSRVSTIKRQYYWTGIKESVFSLVVVIPENYGMARVVPGTFHEHRTGHNLEYFQDPRFKIHPEWLYCKDYKMSFPSPEEQLKYFMQHLKREKKIWLPSRRENISTLCDHALMQAVLFDAQNTMWFYQNLSKSVENTREFNRMNRQYGVVSVFISTHSGLTRWQTLLKGFEDFGNKHPKSIDEVWYHRAVEQCDKTPKSFVYSVNLDASETIENGNQPILVTASHAIFHGVKPSSAPAAVVGYQFHHTSLHSMFMRIVTECQDPDTCERTCRSKNLRCFILDNNAYVLVAKSRKHTGKFFGEIVPTVMQHLIKEGIYEEINIPDYQGVCFVPVDSENGCANSLLTPFRYVRIALKYLLLNLVGLFESFTQMAVDAFYPKYLDADLYDEDVTELIIETTTTPKPKKKKKKKTRQENDTEEQIQLFRWAILNKTEPTPCDREAYLYRLRDIKSIPQRFTNSSESCKRPFLAQPIPFSNLLLVVVNSLCKMDDDTMSTKPFEVDYMDSLVCQRLITMKRFGRKHIQTCIKHHPNEERINECGTGSQFSQISSIFLLIIHLIMKYIMNIFLWI